jgi:2-polyprenyl-3-methyl-5-hydroxy-6-metoxy-1,4-benzoquinol methylase
MTASYYGDPRPDIRALIEPNGARVLDLGCGEGALASSLKSAGAKRVVGIEQDPDAARIARDRLDLVLEGDLEEVMPQLEERFDYLVLADVLEHLPDPDRALASSLEYLDQGGRVLVSVPNMRFYLVLLRLIFDRWSYADSGVRDRTHLRIFTRRSLERMLARHGLVTERVVRRYRLVDDQSEIGRVGAVATRFVQRFLGPLLFRDLMAYQYVVVATRR